MTLRIEECESPSGAMYGVFFIGRHEPAETLNETIDKAMYVREIHNVELTGLALRKDDK